MVLREFWPQNGPFNYENDQPNLIVKGLLTEHSLINAVSRVLGFGTDLKVFTNLRETTVDL